MWGKGFSPHVGPGLQSRPDPPVLKCQLHITAVPLHITAVPAPYTAVPAPYTAAPAPIPLKCPFSTLTQWMWGRGVV
jgi:hypothetical protein